MGGPTGAELFTVGATSLYRTRKKETDVFSVTLLKVFKSELGNLLTLKTQLSLSLALIPVFCLQQVMFPILAGIATLIMLIYVFVLVPHRCSKSPLFRRLTAPPACFEMHQHYRHPVAYCCLYSCQDEHEAREMTALLGCLNGFMTSIYLYRLTQTLTLTLILTTLCLILTLT